MNRVIEELREYAKLCRPALTDDSDLPLTLCQGAALQYLCIGYGVNDFDIHYFYRQNPEKPKLARSGYKRVYTIGSFEKIRVDFFRTVIPERVWRSAPEEPSELLASFLTNGPTPNAKHLAEEAVVGLYPDALFAVTLWSPDRAKADAFRSHPL